MLRDDDQQDQPGTLRRSRFAIVPEWVLFHPGLGAVEVTLYCVLARYANGDDEAWPSRATLAEKMGCSTKTIDRSKTLLERAGALRIHRRFEDGRETSCLYILVFDPPYTGNQGGVDTGDQGGVDTGDQQTRAMLNEKDPPSPPRGKPMLQNQNITPGERWARRWCEIAGEVATRSVLKRYIPGVVEYMEAAGCEPTDEILASAYAQGIRTPRGWGFASHPRTQVVKVHHHRFVDMGEDSRGGYCLGCRRWEKEAQ